MHEQMREQMREQMCKQIREQMREQLCERNFLFSIIIYYFILYKRTQLLIKIKSVKFGLRDWTHTQEVQKWLQTKEQSSDNRLGRASTPKVYTQETSAFNY